MYKRQDLDSVDESIIGNGIQFDKQDIHKNLTLFLYPDDSDEAGQLLRIYQQYFMVSNAAQLILKEAEAVSYTHLVAKAGGIGVISTAQIGYREPDFDKQPEEANLRAIGKEMQKARQISENGIIGYNLSLIHI